MRYKWDVGGMFNGQLLGGRARAKFQSHVFGRFDVGVEPKPGLQCFEKWVGAFRRAKGASKVRVQRWTRHIPIGMFQSSHPHCTPFIPMEAFATPSISYTKPYLLMSPPPVQVGEHSFARAKGADGEALHRPRSKVASRGWAVRQGRVEAESSLRRWLPESHTSEVTVTNKGTSLPTSRHFCDMALEKKYGTPMMRGPTVRIH